MKKKLLLVLAATAMLCLAGCQSESENEVPSVTPTVEATKEPVATNTPTPEPTATPTPEPTPTNTPMPTLEQGVGNFTYLDGFAVFDDDFTASRLKQFGAAGGGVFMYYEDSKRTLNSYDGENLVDLDDYTRHDVIPNSKGYFAMLHPYTGLHFYNGNGEYLKRYSQKYFEGLVDNYLILSDWDGLAYVQIDNLETGESVEKEFYDFESVYLTDENYFYAMISDQEGSPLEWCKVYYDGTYEKLGKAGEWYDFYEKTYMVSQNWCVSYDGYDGILYLYNVETKEYKSYELAEFLKTYCNNRYDVLTNSWHEGKSGNPYINYGTLITFGYYDSESDSTMYVLFDAAKYDAGDLKKAMIGKYSHLELSQTGIHLAANGEDYFYINSDGEVLRDYVSSSAFWGEHAFVIKEDGMVYLIDTEFNETVTGISGTAVHTFDGFFAIETEDKCIALIPME